jgi:hypothetical protein
MGNYLTVHGASPEIVYKKNPMFEYRIWKKLIIISFDESVTRV